MAYLKQITILWILLLLIFTGGHAEEYDYVRNPHVSEETWDRLLPYLLPSDHPIKPKLDELFTSTRLLKNPKSMKKAGFLNPHPLEWARIVVSKHLSLPGYVIKAYLDNEPYLDGEPEYAFFMKRIDGARLIKSEIRKRGIGYLFKVPKKWIYPVPEYPAPSSKAFRKNFILIEEDMNIYPHEQNYEQWQNNPALTPQTLQILYDLIQDLGLADSRPENLPFSKDGRIAFVDTEIFNEWPAKLAKLTKALKGNNKAYWKQIIKSNSK